MDKQSKKNIVKDLRDSFQNSSGVVVTHYLGLNSAELTDLRNQIKAVGSRFCVAKNSLAKLASKSTGLCTGLCTTPLMAKLMVGVKVQKTCPSA